jgi:hypothetical protein
MDYLQLTALSNLPDLSALRPFKTVVLVEDVVTSDRQAAICRWLVEAGCRYIMAWGEECHSWDDSVDLANREKFNFEDIPDEGVVITTWHEDESLKEVFWFAKHTAIHPCFPLDTTVLLHLASFGREQEISAEYTDA